MSFQKMKKIEKGAELRSEGALSVKIFSSSSSSSPLVESNVRLVRSDFLGHLDPIFPLSCLSNNTASTLENDFQEMQTISFA